MKITTFHAAIAVALLASSQVFAQAPADNTATGSQAVASSSPNIFDRTWNWVTGSSSSQPKTDKQAESGERTHAGDPTPTSKDDTSDEDSYRPDAGDPK